MESKARNGSSMDGSPPPTAAEMDWNRAKSASPVPMRDPRNRAPSVAGWAPNTTVSMENSLKDSTRLMMSGSWTGRNTNPAASAPGSDEAAVEREVGRESGVQATLDQFRI